MDTDKYIIEQLNKAIELYGIAPADLARHAGMEPRCLSRSLWGDRTLTAGELVEICVVLGITSLKAFLDEERRRNAAELHHKMTEEFGSMISILGPEWGEER